MNEGMDDLYKTYKNFQKMTLDDYIYNSLSVKYSRAFAHIHLNGKLYQIRLKKLNLIFFLTSEHFVIRKKKKHQQN